MLAKKKSYLLFQWTFEGGGEKPSRNIKQFFKSLEQRGEKPSIRVVTWITQTIYTIFQQPLKTIHTTIINTEKLQRKSLT